MEKIEFCNVWYVIIFLYVIFWVIYFCYIVCFLEMKIKLESKFFEIILDVKDYVIKFVVFII